MNASRLSTTCEKCGARAERDLDAVDGELRAPLPCSACGHLAEVSPGPAASEPDPAAEPLAAEPAAEPPARPLGTWSVVDPDGVVRHFSSWQELIGSLPNSAATSDTTTRVRSTRPSSAAALLGVTPPPPSVGHHLALVPGDDPPPIPQARVPSIDEPAVAADTAEPGESVEPVESLRDEDIVPASDDGREALARARAQHPPARMSGPPPPLPPGALARDPVSSTPPPPKGGALRTLPPPPRHEAPAPPPPTIDVESDPVLPEAVPSSTRAARSGDTKPSASVSSSVREAEAAPQRSWFWRVVAVGVVAAAIFYLARAPGGAARDTAPESNAPDAAGARLIPPEHARATTVPALVSSSPTVPVSPTVAASSPTAPASASGSASAAPKVASGGDRPTAAEKRPVGDSQLALPEVLQRAAAARASGDAVHAKALLERALVLSPGNAEAYGLLGDLARSQGDSAGAKAAYERALATSPGYSPALLGLADTEWDLGDRASAQRHYAAIAASGRSAPARVSERAGQGGGAKAAPAATSPTSPEPSPASSSTTEPEE